MNPLPKILYVDPDPNLRKQVSTYLSWYGLGVEELEDTAEAESRLESRDYGLLICEVWSSPRNGFEMVRSIRQSGKPALRNLGVLLVAPDVLDEEGYRFLRKWKVSFMSKYQEIQEWVDKISSLLRVT